MSHSKTVNPFVQMIPVLKPELITQDYLAAITARYKKDGWAKYFTQKTPCNYCGNHGYFYGSTYVHHEEVDKYLCEHCYHYWDSCPMAFTGTSRKKHCVPLVVRLKLNKVRNRRNPVPILMDESDNDPQGWRLLPPTLKELPKAALHIPNNWMITRSHQYGGGYAIMPECELTNEQRKRSRMLELGAVSSDSLGDVTSLPQDGTKKCAVAVKGAPRGQPKAPGKAVGQPASSSSSDGMMCAFHDAFLERLLKLEVENARLQVDNARLQADFLLVLKRLEVLEQNRTGSGADDKAASSPEQ